ncbi:MAG: ribosome silencing factor [Treponema sp.]|jgi:ribosome-associated protein|nr:ribosome silencing factor [Treponema sp.]
MLQADDVTGQTGFLPAEPRDAALALGALLQDHRALDVAVLDLRECNSWTDFFVIATVTSLSHLEGLERHIKEFCREQDLEILRHSPRSSHAAEDDWRLTDLGNVVVHLMSGRARNFYELERLWSAASRIFP